MSKSNVLIIILYTISLKNMNDEMVDCSQEILYAVSTATSPKKFEIVVHKCDEHVERFDTGFLHNKNNAK